MEKKEKARKPYNGKEGEVCFQFYIQKDLKDALTYAAWYRRLSIK